MLTERQGDRLPQWLDVVRQDDLPSLHTLATGIDRDRDALKRQMFGRADFGLLRKWVLLAP
ncbi:hypothetical protein [Streptomyces sp. NP-1717]|uniref:hypothetical protein n=1 Tax=unclassified Streptomyces TaxID=2593676 RepID=UPI001F5DE60F|nr:hypothetical protein [Streptomyces sp. NP-1717]MCI3221865.1 hypothetical protein [Streptomyces sp. NP-1717]WTA78035.1 hypothetical protein OG705_36705 [Streptomyces sp. NBC_00838]